MTYEGGDFTYETEYVGDPRRWPLSSHPSAQAGDPFDALAHIQAPTLLLHGEADDICLPSQSKVAYHILHTEGVPTELIIYPGEPHGFKRPANRRDRDQRMLRWFISHMPPHSPKHPES